MNDLIQSAGADLRARLIKICFEKSHAVKDGNPGHTRLMSYLSSLDRDTRAVVVAKDMAGLTVDHIAVVINLDVTNVRKCLAEARKEMAGIFGS